jgi:plasmid stabilization system protein ParE
MSLEIVFRRAARREFDEATAWYEERLPGLGAQFVTAIDQALQQVADKPQQFPVVHAGLRCVHAYRFPYSVFFRIETRRVVVMAVFHARRDPAIWQNRAQP